MGESQQASGTRQQAGYRPPRDAVGQVCRHSQTTVSPRPLMRRRGHTGTCVANRGIGDEMMMMMMGLIKLIIALAGM